MLFSAILSVCFGLISFVTMRKFYNVTDTYLAIFRSAAMALVLFIISLVVSNVIFQHMFKLQTYCESEPDDVTELVSVSEPGYKSALKDYVEVVNILNAGKKFVVADSEFYYYCRTILDPYLEKKQFIIEKIEKTNEIQVKESDSPYAGAGVVKIYHYEYVSWWGKFFFDKPLEERWVFLIPKGTLGKGKIIIPDPLPIFVPNG